MRIIAGEARGRRISAPDLSNVRPTGDRVKEALFNILQGRIVGRTVLDLFAGSGNLGLEALSRGAEWATFVDKAPQCRQIIANNIANLGYSNRSEVILSDALDFLSVTNRRYDIVFLDPPYSEDLAMDCLRLLQSRNILLPGADVVIEHGKNQYQELMAECRKYGDTYLSFLKF